jgi:hypothetical protein
MHENRLIREKPVNPGETEAGPEAASARRPKRGRRSSVAGKRFWTRSKQSHKIELNYGRMGEDIMPG